MSRYWAAICYDGVIGILLSLLLFFPHSATPSPTPNNNHNRLQNILLELQKQLKSVHRPQFSRHFFDQDVNEPQEFTNEWVTRVLGGENSARNLASTHGFEYVGRVRGTDDLFIFRHLDENVHKRDMSDFTKRLTNDERVDWAERQRVKRRMKRDHIDFTEEDMNFLFNDPYWPKQWQLHDTRTEDNLPKLDLHVIGAWKQGITGKGVVVSILDDGIQRNHSDLAQNYDPKASYDLNGEDEDPMPTFDINNKHGTRCAGEVSMVANNGICGVGVAYNSNIGGVRMLDGKITDRLESDALQFNIQHVDIFSASWGPNDNGKTVEGPGRLAEAALKKGITEGRGGKGTIYAWASGNGGTYQDDCNCDGYTDSIYTLSVSSASQSGKFPWYGEKCASTLAATYSSGAYTDQKITTTDLVDECTTSHTGTSASAPLAAGIVALGLEANPELTWRDVQHITIWTSEPYPLMNNNGWQKNGFGLHISPSFGFGLMNAEGFVTAAKSWVNVPQQFTCTTTFPNFEAKEFSADSPTSIKFRTNACTGQKNVVKYLEHLQLVVDIDYTRRGNLEIFLTSPQGTRTKLLSPRRRDNSEEGFRDWPFMSVHTWGEDPSGYWFLEVADEDSENGMDHGIIKNISMVLHGTKDQPEHYKNGPRIYNSLYNDVHDRDLHNKKVKRLQDDAKRMAESLVKRLAEAEELSSSEKLNMFYRINRALDLIDQSLEEDKNFRKRSSTTSSYHLFHETLSK